MPDDSKVSGKTGTVTMDELQDVVAYQVAALHQEQGDPFRRLAYERTKLQLEYGDKIKDEAISTYALIAGLRASRDRALALTHFELAIMMAVKAATAPGAFKEGS